MTICHEYAISQGEGNRLLYTHLDTHSLQLKTP